MKNLLVITLLFSSFGLYSQSIILDCEDETEYYDQPFYKKIEIINFAEGGTVMLNNFPMKIYSLGNERIMAESEYYVGSFQKRIRLQIDRMSNEVIQTHWNKEFSGEWKEAIAYNYNCKLR